MLQRPSKTHNIDSSSSDSPGADIENPACSANEVTKVLIPLLASDNLVPNTLLELEVSIDNGAFYNI